MQFNVAAIKLTENAFDTRGNGRMVCAIAGDVFFDDCPQRCGCQQQVRDSHKTTEWRREIETATFDERSDAREASIRIKFREQTGVRRYFDGFFPFDCCLIAFCFLLLSLSFLPPLSPIVDSPCVEVLMRASAVGHCCRLALGCPT
jgi:hypothetical protein